MSDVFETPEEVDGLSPSSRWLEQIIHAFLCS